MLTRTRLALVLAFAAATSPVFATDPAPAVKVTRNVKYATVGGEKLYLDIAIPEGEGPFPCP
ncbi:MAG: hypothetical protein U0792_08975 [Gemmataceae bacterium]